MPSLIDIGKSFKAIPINGVDVDCTGISADGLVQLISRFPDLKRIIVERKADHIDADLLMKLGPEIVGAIGAAGTGHPGEKDHEKLMRSLPLGQQVALIKTILEVTFPFGVQRFVEDMAGLGLGVQSAPANLNGSGKDGATISVEPSPTLSEKETSTKTPPGK